jgi:hypothetical protein
LFENDNILEFTIQGCHVSFVNGIRRTLYSEIPVNAFITEKYEENQCKINKNTTRFHNEIVKQRLAVYSHQRNQFGDASRKIHIGTESEKQHKCNDGCNNRTV